MLPCWPVLAPSKPQVPACWLLLASSWPQIGPPQLLRPDLSMVFTKALPLTSGFTRWSRRLCLLGLAFPWCSRRLCLLAWPFHGVHEGSPLGPGFSMVFTKALPLESGFSKDSMVVLRSRFILSLSFYQDVSCWYFFQVALS